MGGLIIGLFNRAVSTKEVVVSCDMGYLRNADLEVSGRVRGCLEDQERDGTVTLRWVSGKHIMWLELAQSRSIGGFCISCVETLVSASRHETW